MAYSGKTEIGGEINRFDKRFMLRAIELAKAAGERGEIPCGAVIEKNGEIIAEGSNRREETRSALSHAEIEAINAACRALGDWRLTGCTLYVTLEPCPMCAGAIINARIQTVVFGAFDSCAGSFESVTDLSRLPFESRPQVFGGVCEEECAGLLKSFFDKRRTENRER